MPMPPTAVPRGRMTTLSVDEASLKKFISRLRRRAAKTLLDRDVSVAVGYGTRYAIYVHENLKLKHPKGGKAKYLTDPLHERADEIAKTVTRQYQKQRTLAYALVVAGRYLQTESEKQVPVDTGMLKRSAFTTLERGTM